LSKLGPESPIVDFFEEIAVSEGVNVVPATIKRETEGDLSRHVIFICGHSEEADLILANLMAYVDNLKAATEQHMANQEANNEPSIIVP
jgi:hypothetical protein